MRRAASSEVARRGASHIFVEETHQLADHGEAIGIVRETNGRRALLVVRPGPPAPAMDFSCVTVLMTSGP